MNFLKTHYIQNIQNIYLCTKYLSEEITKISRLRIVFLKDKSQENKLFKHNQELTMHLFKERLKLGVVQILMKKKILAINGFGKYWNIYF